MSVSFQHIGSLLPDTSVHQKKKNSTDCHDIQNATEVQISYSSSKIVQSDLLDMTIELDVLIVQSDLLDMTIGLDVFQV